MSKMVRAITSHGQLLGASGPSVGRTNCDRFVGAAL